MEGGGGGCKRRGMQVFADDTLTCRLPPRPQLPKDQEAQIICSLISAPARMDRVAKYSNPPRVNLGLSTTAAVTLSDLN